MFSLPWVATAGEGELAPGLAVVLEFEIVAFAWLLLLSELHAVVSNATINAKHKSADPGINL